MASHYRRTWTLLAHIRSRCQQFFGLAAEQPKDQLLGPVKAGCPAVAAGRRFAPPGRLGQPPPGLLGLAAALVRHGQKQGSHGVPVVVPIPSAGNLFVATSSVNTPPVAEVIRDADNDLVIKSGETLASSTSALAKDGQFTVSLSAPGIYYLHIVTDGVDGDYDVSFGLKSTVGTFVLNPAATTVEAGDRAKLALDWTVPNGSSWHTLQDVQIRLRNVFGTLALINFHEADNSVSLFNPDTGEFGPAKAMGSNAVLANRYVSIFLRTSTLTAAGANSPTVTLTFDIQFKQALSGRPVTIEAAASDDFGRVQDFAFAGTLNVRDHKDR